MLRLSFLWLEITGKCVSSHVSTVTPTAARLGPTGGCDVRTGYG